MQSQSRRLIVYEEARLSQSPSQGNTLQSTDVLIRSSARSRAVARVNRAAIPAAISNTGTKAITHIGLLTSSIPLLNCHN